MPKDIQIKFESADLPGLYHAADKASLAAQTQYLLGLKAYMFFLVLASLVAYFSADSANTAIVSVSLFLVSIGITIWLNVKKPEDIWYNGRAVAESVIPCQTSLPTWNIGKDTYLAMDDAC